MNTLATILATTGPLAAGWSGHVLWLRRRLRTARRDPVTGLRTREGFPRRAAALLRDDRAVVVLADVDHFKQINDRHGHAAGDALLKATADRLAHYVGPNGVAGRLGGDEFAAVVLDTDGTVADLLAVFHGVLARPADQTNPHVATTVSLGWVRAADFPGEDLSALLGRADEAMYAAKQSRAGIKGAGWGGCSRRSPAAGRDAAVPRPGHRLWGWWRDAGPARRRPLPQRDGGRTAPLPVRRRMRTAPREG